MWAMAGSRLYSGQKCRVQDLCDSRPALLDALSFLFPHLTIQEMGFGEKLSLGLKSFLKLCPAGRMFLASNIQRPFRWCFFGNAGILNCTA